MIKRFAGICLSFTISGYAYGALLVDTGQPQIDPYAGYGGLTLYSDQSLAAKISLSSGATITGIQTYFGDSGGGTYTIALYADQGTIPNAGSELFSKSVAQTATLLAGPVWDGTSGLDWQVAAGDYWVAFEVRPGQTLWSSLVDDPGPPNPLSNYAFNYVANGSWLPVSNGGWGMKVEGDLAPVPLPGSLWLLSSGLIGLMGSRRFRRTKLCA